MGLFDWSTDANSNTGIDSVNIAENCPPGGINNAIRAVMANVRTAFSSGLAGFFNGTDALPVTNGGTGGKTQAAARTGLGLGSMATQSADAVAITGGTIAGLTSALAVSSGGTGGNTQATAHAALSVLGVVTASLGQSGSLSIRVAGQTKPFILQWGVISSIAPNDNVDVTFPTAYTTWALPIPASVTTSGSTSENQNNGLAYWSLTGFRFQNAGDNYFSNIPWLSIGQ